jgi:hypothetical protein
MIRQVSAWGQFWFDLSAQHNVQGAGIVTPLCEHLPHPPYRGAYYSTWVKWHNGSPIYHSVDGATMTQMIRNGLIKTGCYNLRMKVALLAVLLEDIHYKLARAYP